MVLQGFKIERQLQQPGILRVEEVEDLGRRLLIITL